MSAAVPITSRPVHHGRRGLSELRDDRVAPAGARYRKTGRWCSAASPGSGRRSRRFAPGLANTAGTTCGSGSTASATTTTSSRASWRETTIPATLKALSDALINDTGWKRNERASAGGEVCVDPFAMNGGAKARIGSLKEIACKLDAPSLRTLALRARSRADPRRNGRRSSDYNAVDLEVTAMVAACQAATINARIALAREYQSRKVINVHDAKLAELVLAHRLFGIQPAEIPEDTELAPAWPPGHRGVLVPHARAAGDGGAHSRDDAVRGHGHTN